MIEVRQTDVFTDWFAGLRDREARARITVRIRRLSLGNPGDVKPVGSGVSEMRIDYGPGYRVYFVGRGDTVVVRSAAVTNDTRIATSRAPSNWRKKFREDDMARKTTRWDAADSLETKEDIAAYLDAVLEDGDPDLLKAALGDIARAKGMTEIAQAAGLGRANLYKALSPDGNPEFATVARVLKALGLRLSVAA
jgi:probable addiction module antidote protein/putative addiction module killer protein